MTVRVSEVAFANAPGHILRFANNLDTRSQGQTMDLIDIFHPNGHPDAVVLSFVTGYLKGCAV